MQYRIVRQCILWGNGWRRCTCTRYMELKYTVEIHCSESVSRVPGKASEVIENSERSFGVFASKQESAHAYLCLYIKRNVLCALQSTISTSILYIPMIWVWVFFFVCARPFFAAFTVSLCMYIYVCMYVWHSLSLSFPPIGQFPQRGGAEEKIDHSHFIRHYSE